jgi:hypothetical protein
LPVDAVTVEPLEPVGREAAAAARRGPLPLSLPGCVHHALMDAGLIPPPDLDDGEERQAWAGRAGWRIVARFDSPARAAGERVVVRTSSSCGCAAPSPRSSVSPASWEADP